MSAGWSPRRALTADGASFAPAAPGAPARRRAKGVRLFMRTALDLAATTQEIDHVGDRVAITSRSLQTATAVMRIGGGHVTHSEIAGCASNALRMHMSVTRRVEEREREILTYMSVTRSTTQL